MESENKTIESPKGLYNKLLAIQNEVNGLGKDKDTKSQANPNGYKYVTGDKVLSHIKPLMNKYGLLLKQEITSIENTRQDYKGKYAEKSEILTKAMMLFTWVDCETGDTDVNAFGANGMNDWEKGLGSALTYAERYFLLKYFHICTDEDDIDNPERKPEEKPKEPTAPKAPAKAPVSNLITEAQTKELEKQATMKDVFSDGQIDGIITWLKTPRTEAIAQQFIEKNRALITEKRKAQ